MTLENRMVIGEYFPDPTIFDRALEMANGQNYVDFIFSRGDEDTVLSHWLGVILPPQPPTTCGTAWRITSARTSASAM